jgi:hypothetical protein
MNDMSAPHVKTAAWTAVGVSRPTNRPPARARPGRPTPTTSPKSAAPCTRRWACRQGAREDPGDRPGRRARQPRRGRGLHGAGHPRHQRLRPHHPRRSDPGRWPGPVRGPAGLHRRRGHPRQRAPRRAKGVVTYEELPAILTPQAGAKRQVYVLPPMRLRAAMPRRLSKRAPHTVKGELYVGGQEQFYLEGQIAYAIPQENDGMLVQCSTQHPSEMQHVVAHALGLHSHHVVVECRRMGGGFGGKESQSALWAAAAAVSARLTGRPVKLRADRDDDMLVTGKRHCFHYEYEVGYDERRPHRRGEGRHGLARRLLGRPVRPGGHARRLPLRQYLLPVRRRHPRRLRQDQHAVEHRLPRLRRPAGRDRDGVRARRDRAQSRPRRARHPQAEFLRQRPGATSRPTARSSSTT